MRLQDYLDFLDPHVIRLKGHRIGLEDIRMGNRLSRSQPFIRRFLLSRSTARSPTTFTIAQRRMSTFGGSMRSERQGYGLLSHPT